MAYLRLSYSVLTVSVHSNCEEIYRILQIAKTKKIPPKFSYFALCAHDFNKDVNFAGENLP